MSRCLVLVSAVALSLSALAPASALTSKECSVKYQAAKTANTLNGQSWNDFRKAQCSDAAAPAAAAPAPTKTVAPAPAPAAPAPAPTAAAKPAPAPAATPAAAGAAVFPKAIDPKYASESAGKGRQKTCLDQYNANKAAGATGNGGMNWIQKGGGYYSECNKRLKG